MQVLEGFENGTLLAGCDIDSGKSRFPSALLAGI
jgi:hypothetical protein